MIKLLPLYSGIYERNMDNKYRISIPSKLLKTMKEREDILINSGMFEQKGNLLLYKNKIIGMLDKRESIKKEKNSTVSAVYLITQNENMQIKSELETFMDYNKDNSLLDLLRIDKQKRVLIPKSMQEEIFKKGQDIIFTGNYGTINIVVNKVAKQN